MSSDKNASSTADPSQDLDLTREEREKLESVEKKQESFLKWLEKKGAIPAGDKAVLSLKTYEEFAKHWSSAADDSKINTSQRREQGWRKWALRFESFAVGADRFMKDFNGMMEFAKVAGSPYCGPAISTVAVLFTIARNKRDLDDQVASAVLGIKDRLPGFNMYQRIYDYDPNKPTEMRTGLIKDLKKKIVLAYVMLIDLSIEATKYYLKGGLRRWMQAAFRSEKFEKFSDRVQSAVSAVRMRCDELLALTVHEIRQQNIELLTKVSGLEAFNEETIFTDIRNFLDLSAWSLDDHKSKLDEYKAELEKDETDDSIMSQRFGGIEPNYEPPGTTFQEWRSSDLSSMLLFVGENDELVSHGRRTCWLSVKAFALIDDLRNTKTCHASYAFSVYKTTPIFPVLCKLVLQLLRWKISLFRDGIDFDELRTYLDRYKDLGMGRREEKKRALVAVALKALGSFSSNETVYVVIDRVDRCEGEDQLDLLTAFLDISETCKCTLKIFITAKDMGWELGESEIRGHHGERFLQERHKQNLIG